MKVEIEVKPQTIADAMVTAIEGGSGYWMQRAKLVSSEHQPVERPWYSCPKVYEGAFAIEIGFDDPDREEGNGAGRKIITQDDVAKGIAAMLSKPGERAASHMADLITENGDAISADVFLQHVVLGDTVYG